MEKLIELLTEYERSKWTNLEIMNWKCVYWNLSYFWYGNWYSELLLVSNRYGFIEWLVDNDKIDISKIKCWYVYNDTEEDKVKNVIMNLSISDTPIEDLISYLK